VPRPLRQPTNQWPVLYTVIHPLQQASISISGKGRQHCELVAHQSIDRHPLVSGHHPLASLPPSYSVGTTRCFDRLWLVRPGGRPGSLPPNPRELFPLRPDARPRSSSQLVSQRCPAAITWPGMHANALADGKKVSIEGMEVTRLSSRCCEDGQPLTAQQQPGQH
jgi:hypothetical protein